MVTQPLREITISTTGRLLSTGCGLFRCLCTAASSIAETAVAPVEDVFPAGTSPAKAGTWRLRRRFLALGSTPGKIADILHQHIMEGNRIGKIALCNCIKELRKKKRYQHCLEIFEWMDKGNYGYNDKDYAIRIDIICKSNGIVEAEKYFESLSLESKNLYTFGALLNCYCKETLADKAAALFEKMDKLNYLTTLSFNNMMTLALRTGEPEKVPGLVEEMKTRNIELKLSSYSLLMQSYKQLGNIDGVEKTIDEIEKNVENCEWTIYSDLAATYLSAGSLEKAETALKKLEESSKSLRGTDPVPYHYLISFYASLGNLVAVNRLWDSLKSDFQPTGNLSYLVMIQSLSKLGKVDQMQKCYDEWKPRCRRFDTRITGSIIPCYLKRNMIEEAEQIFDEAVEKSGLPFIRGREIFISHFLGKRDINSALRHLQAAINELKKNDRWQPDKEKIDNFWKYFEEEKDVDGAEEFFKLLKKVKCLDSTAYASLLGVYVAAGKTAPEMHQRMKQDGIEITGDHDILLEKMRLAKLAARPPLQDLMGYSHVWRSIFQYEILT